MANKPHILITNDDGIHAPGLRHLWHALKDYCDLTIVAPATEQSSVGMSITVRSPLYIRRIDWPEDTHAWAVSGTPADCVKMARSQIMQNVPDMIVSGINCGSNAGRNILYSGTVAGVIEGSMRDIPGVAFSTGNFTNPNYAAAERWIVPIIKHVWEHPMPRGTILNVNFPHDKLGPYRGVKMTRQGRQHYTEFPSQHHHPCEGNPYYWLGFRVAEFDEHEESDIYWLNQGYVTAAPIHVEELTDHRHLKEHKEHFESKMRGD